MAGGGNFIHRVMSYVANELIVNGLANSPAFQRFAVRTSKRIENVSVKGMRSYPMLLINSFAAEVKKKVSEQVAKNFESFKNE